MTFLGLAPSRAVAVVDSATGEHLTYLHVMSRGRGTAVTFGEQKQVIFLFARNDAFSAVTYWGALNAGHAVALLDCHAATGTIASLVDIYRPTWVVGAVGLGERLAVVGVDVADALQVEGGELVRTSFSVRTDVHPDLGLMLSTSGTTGSRKLVRLSIHNVEANAKSIAECLKLTSDDRPLALLPLHYSFGLSVVNSHWRVGATVVLTEDGVLQRRLWQTFGDEECTSLAGVPYTYQMLERVGFRDMDLPSLRSLQQAGGALDRQLTELYRNHMTQRNGRFFVMYGQTEATARIAWVPPDRLAHKLGAAGLPIPSGQLRIISDLGPDHATEVTGTDATTVGEVVYEGPNVMLGYALTAEDLASGDELGGVLRTGDIGYIDKDGFLFIVGRSNRIAKVFGHRINLDEVEVMVREWGPAAVVDGGDAVWAFCAFGDPVELDELSRTIAARLRIHHTGLRFRHVDTIPSTNSGKVDYGVVQAWVQTLVPSWQDGSRRPRPSSAPGSGVP